MADKRGGLLSVPQMYQEYVGRPTASLLGGALYGYLGLEKPSYGGEQAYRTAQAVGNMPVLGAPVGVLKAAMHAPEAAVAVGGLLGKVGAGKLAQSVSRLKAPQDEALETARKNAVKMLGLPESNTATDRAKALGFDTVAYKGMHPYDPNTGEVWGVRNGRFVPVANIGAEPEVIRSVDQSRTSKMELGGRHAGFYGGKDIANAFAGYTSKNSAVFPVLLNMGKNQEIFEGAGKHAGAFQFERPAAMNDNLDEYKRFQRAFLADSPSSGAVIRDTVDEGTIFIPKEGKQVRSRFAAFDPARVNENDLLGNADPRLLALIAAGTGGGLLGYNYLNDR